MSFITGWFGMYTFIYIYIYIYGSIYIYIYINVVVQETTVLMHLFYHNPQHSYSGYNDLVWYNSLSYRYRVLSDCMYIFLFW